MKSTNTYGTFFFVFSIIFIFLSLVVWLFFYGNFVNCPNDYSVGGRVKSIYHQSFPIENDINNFVLVFYLDDWNHTYVVPMSCEGRNVSMFRENSKLGGDRLILKNKTVWINN